MTDLEKALFEMLKKDGLPTLSYMGTNVEDMTRKELELLCILLGCQSLQEKPIIKVSPK